MGWPGISIEESAKVVSGGTPKSGTNEYWDGDIQWITPKDMGKMAEIYASETSRKISQLGLEKSSAKLIPENSVILSTRAPIGHLVINTVPMATNQGCRGLVPNEDLDTKYLYYFLLKSVDLLNDLGTGTTFKELSKSALERVEIPLPPIPKQKRIVAILDQAFADIERARELTECNLHNACELFESYLQKAFSQRGEGWQTRKIEDLTSLITKGSSPKWQGISYVEKPGVLFITSENVGVNQMIYKKTKYVEDAFNTKDSKSILQKGDVLTNIVGASIGRTAIFDKDEVANINQAVCLMRCDSEILHNEYLAYLLNSPYLVKVLHDNEIDNARANLSLGFFRKLEVPVPSIEGQKNLVNQIKSIHKKTHSLEIIYQNKLDDLDELKKSLLQKAFNGGLTQKDKDAA